MASAVLKREVNAIIDQLPESATLSDVMEVLQNEIGATLEERALIAQERDAGSALNDALRQAVAAMDAGQGVPHDEVLRRYEPRA